MNKVITNKKALELINISKIYGNGFIANENINIDVKYGEIHAILGENGAGKSTLMKTIFGMHQPTSGKILIDGEPVKINSPNVATDLGIGMVHQHFQLINNFSVLDNIILGYELKTKTKVNQINYLSDIYLAYLEKIEQAKIAKINHQMFEAKKYRLEAKIYHQAKRIDYKVAKKLAKITHWYNKANAKKLNDNEQKHLEQKHHDLLEMFDLFNKKMGYALEKLDYQLNDEIALLKTKEKHSKQKKINNEVILASKVNKIKRKMNRYRRIIYGVKRAFQTRFWLKRTEAINKINEICQIMNFKLDLKAKVGTLSVYDQQKIEILKVLYRDAKILILDEPTGVLTPQEIEELMKILTRFKSQNKAIILITHKLNEIKSVADRCTVIRKGQYIDTVKVDKVKIDTLAKLMVGRKVNFTLKKKPQKDLSPLLTMKNIETQSQNKVKVLKNFSLEINRGEILGIAGIEGNGQEHIVDVICRYLKPLHGALTFHQEVKVVNKVINKYHQIALKKAQLENKNIKIGDYLKHDINLLNWPAKDIYNLGIHHIPADRQKQGLILDMNLWENIALRSQFNAKYQVYGLLKINKIKEATEQIITNYDVRGANSVAILAKTLSGGNQQKLIIGRELSENPQLIIAVQPTRGLDVGAIEYVYHSLLEQRNKGNAVLLISSELDEVMNLSDRIVAINNGKKIGESLASEVTKEKLGLMMAGVRLKNE